MGSKEEGGKEEEEKKKKNSGSSAKLPNGFDCRCYLNRYADLQMAFGTNCERAKAHYINHGRKEKRKYKCSEQRLSPTPKLPNGGSSAKKKKKSTRPRPRPRPHPRPRPRPRARPSPTPSCDSKTANKCYCNHGYRGKIAMPNFVNPICSDDEGTHDDDRSLGYDCHNLPIAIKEFINMNFAKNGKYVYD